MKRISAFNIILNDNIKFKNEYYNVSFIERDKYFIIKTKLKHLTDRILSTNTVSNISNIKFSYLIEGEVVANVTLNIYDTKIQNGYLCLYTNEYLPPDDLILIEWDKINKENKWQEILNSM